MNRHQGSFWKETAVELKLEKQLVGIIMGKRIF